MQTVYLLIIHITYIAYRCDGLFEKINYSVTLSDLFIRSENDKSVIETLLSEIISVWRFNPNDLGLNPATRILSFGYPVEKHVIKTEDGYLISVIRIPWGIHNLNQTKGINRPVVFIQPGLFCTASCFIDMNPTQSLAYVLADTGYDVWIANTRGTSYSRHHTIYNSMRHKAYWQFSFHEIGVNDVPSIIDYILRKTNQTQVNYIGHSLGGTALFVMLSEKPGYNKKINVAFTWAPVIFLENIMFQGLWYIPRGIRTLIVTLLKLLSTLEIMNVYDIAPYSTPLAEYIIKRCNSNSTNQEMDLCKAVIALFNQNDPRPLTSLLNYYPAGSSIKTLQHYGQLIETGGFKQFDFGFFKNLKVYGQTTPPDYNLSNVNAPIYIMYAIKDTLTPPTSLSKLVCFVRSAKLLRIKNPFFGHGEFIYGQNLTDDVYKHLIRILNKFNGM